jgi:hypothetical protein
VNTVLDGGKSGKCAEYLFCVGVSVIDSLKSLACRNVAIRMGMGMGK